MPTYEQNKKAAQKYLSQFESITIRMPKDDHVRDQIHQHASDMGESVNAFVLRAITEAMQRDKIK